MSYDINKRTSTTAILRVKRAATVVIARSRPKAPQVLKLSDVIKGEEGAATDNRIQHVFGDKPDVTFTSNWELLMGQGEVQNYLRSTPDKVSLMRYGGEFKFAGGSVDPGESLEQAARRELAEEFDCEVPASSKLRLFDVKQTRPVQNTSYIMFNFLALEEENPWIAELNVDDLNTRLTARRERFQLLQGSGAFWEMGHEEREAVSPEVHSVQWLDMRTAVAHCFTSMNSDVTYVNDFQRAEFERLGVQGRDPLFITMSVMTELESYPSVQSIVRATDGLDADVEQARVQWLVDGMAPQDVQATMETRQRARAEGKLGSVKSAEQLAEAKRRRRALEADNNNSNDNVNDNSSSSSSSSDGSTFAAGAKSGPPRGAGGGGGGAL